MEGCPSGPSCLEAEFGVDGSLFLVKGWRSFLQAHGVKPGYVAQFRFDGSGTFYMKFFDHSYCHADCCSESDSSDDPAWDSDSEEHQIPEWP